MTGVVYSQDTHQRKKLIPNPWGLHDLVLNQGKNAGIMPALTVQEQCEGYTKVQSEGAIIAHLDRG